MMFMGFIILCIIAIQQQQFTTNQNSISTSNQYDDTNNYNQTTRRRRLWPKLISDPKTLEKIDRNSKISREEFYKYKYGDGYDDNSLILPNILFLGAQKAGSTSISHWLFNGGVCKAKLFPRDEIYFGKEVHYFDYDKRYSQGVEFYSQRFEQLD